MNGALHMSDFRIMARTPAIAEEVYTRLVKELAEQGYDTSLLQKVPQRCLGRGR